MKFRINKKRTLFNYFLNFNTFACQTFTKHHSILRLTKLEIKGFKSFAERTIINFNEDVTGIIGPNGCGKSNVVDAIRWVLGEQKSRELRLEKMTNVIFNGTKKRKAGGMAEVSLTFENDKGIIPSEYNMVTITRVLFSTGDSEYRLNNVSCRLKDIRSLFIDTGIGSNSYAIIALGMVDDILHDRENSRRKLFEQAAGISKYKTRKKETLRKLKNTTEDLDRVEDLLFEIENNLKVLEKQAKRARKYFDIKIEYKEKSIELAKHRIIDFKEDYKTIKKQLQEQEDQLLATETKIKTLEAELEKEKLANLDKEKALSDKQRHLNRLVGQLRAMENEKQLAEQRLKFLRNSQKQIVKRMDSADAAVQKFQEEITFYETQVQAESNLEIELENQLVDAKEKLANIEENHSTLKSDLDIILKEQQGLEREMFDLEKQKAISQSQVENYKRDIVRSSEILNKRREEIKGIQEKLTQAEEEKKKISEHITQMESAQDAREVELKIQQQKEEEIKEEISKINRTLDAKRNEYQLTKSMVDNLEGFSESIKFLSKNKNWTEKAPLLSDLIYVQEEYRVAIENYLDPYLNYYVVKDLSQAHDAIQLLNQSQKGKAKFFLLNNIQQTTQTRSKMPSTQAAIEVVECEEKYQSLISHLLENVFITLEERVKSDLEEKQITLISKSGKFIQKREEVSGGSVGLFEGKKIGRKKNLEVLKKVIQELENQRKEQSDTHHKIKERIKEIRRADQAHTIRLQRRELEQVARTHIALKAKMENFENFEKETIDKTHSLQLKIEELEERVYQLENELNLKKAEAEVATQKIQEADSTYRLAAEQLTNATNQYNQNNITYIKQQNKVNTLRKELEFRKSQLADTQLKLFADKDGIAENESNIGKSEQQISAFTEQLQDLYQQKKEKQKNLSEVEQIYYNSRGGINDIEGKIRQQNNNSKTTQQLIATLKDKFNDIKLNLTSIGERLKAEFEIDINDIINSEPNPEIELELLKDKVEKLRKRLFNYGEINPMAVEAYDEMKVRFENITEQRDDILKAKDALLQTIKEIEETATEKFMTSFEQVRTHFIDVFRSLFHKDDNCDLFLENPGNPLESNIKIIAKPKGKRPQSINQLSGGEKTLTATALLFSLYLLKPTPFCIFDEVDAPLDDANIDKFNNIIQKFSKDSQFIIVTHNKSTMAFMDVIYAVSMEEGVSMVIPADFRDFDHKTTTEILES